MTEANQTLHIDAELSKARGSWAAASALLGLGLYDEAISSMYYAIYHQACAALLLQGVEAESHRGLQSLVALHLVKSGLVEPACSRLLAEMYSLRNQADYNRHFHLDAAGANEEVARGVRLAAAFDNYLLAQGCGVLGPLPRGFAEVG